MDWTPWYQGSLCRLVRVPNPLPQETTCLYADALHGGWLLMAKGEEQISCTNWVGAMCLVNLVTAQHTHCRLQSLRRIQNEWGPLHNTLIGPCIECWPPIGGGDASREKGDQCEHQSRATGVTANTSSPLPLFRFTHQLGHLIDPFLTSDDRVGWGSRSDQAETEWKASCTSKQHVATSLLILPQPPSFSRINTHILQWIGHRALEKLSSQVGLEKLSSEGPQLALLPPSPPALGNRPTKPLQAKEDVCSIFWPQLVNHHINDNNWTTLCSFFHLRASPFLLFILLFIQPYQTPPNPGRKIWFPIVLVFIPGLSPGLVNTILSHSFVHPFFPSFSYILKARMYDPS